ncbi:MAG: hypothetical protein HY056_05170 [Proteobacteria bacterium]|nr:hypothetical protein [Pseudomonadota bacterium]
MPHPRRQSANSGISRRFNFGRLKKFQPECSNHVAGQRKFADQNGDALVAAAVAGRGLIYQPTFIINAELRAGRLISFVPDHPTVEFPGVFAVYASDRRALAKVRTFIDVLEKRYCQR